MRNVRDHQKQGSKKRGSPFIRDQSGILYLNSSTVVYIISDIIGQTTIPLRKVTPLFLNSLRVYSSKQISDYMEMAGNVADEFRTTHVKSSLSECSVSELHLCSVRIILLEIEEG